MKTITKARLQNLLETCVDHDPTKHPSLLELARCSGLSPPVSVINLISAIPPTGPLGIPFQFGMHNLSFSNFADGIPSWSTFNDTFGTGEITEEMIPVWGHPILTGAFYLFYNYFLKGKDNGGLATGFCTSLASLVADNFWQGKTDTPTITKASVHKMLTAVHGKLLSRESLLHFHDKGRAGVARVGRTYR